MVVIVTLNLPKLSSWKLSVRLAFGITRCVVSLMRHLTVLWSPTVPRDSLAVTWVSGSLPWRILVSVNC